MTVSATTFRTKTSERGLLLNGLNVNQKEFLKGFVKTEKLLDKEYEIARHEPKTIQLLKHVDVKVPGLDVGFDFHHEDPKFKYYVHQKITAGFLAENHRAWCLNGLRSGKTYSAVTAREILRELGYTGKTVILSPENVMHEAWGDSYALAAPDVGVYVSDKSVAHLNEHGFGRDEVDVIVLNHGKLPYCVEDLDRWDPRFIIVDEGSVYKTYDKEPANNLTFLARNREFGDFISDKPDKRWLWTLTGTPITTGGENIYVMCRLINPSLMDMSFNQWRRKVSDRIDVRHPVTKRFLFPKWVGKDEKIVEKLCAERMKPSIRYRTQDCIELPPQAFSYYYTPPTGDQKTLYAMVAKKLAGSVDGDNFKATTSLNKNNKLLQIASGTVINTAGQWIELGAKKRIDALLELYHQAEGKVVVFVEYKASATYIKDALKSKRIKVDIINSDVSQAKRDKIRKAFQIERRKSVLVMHPETTRFGTNVSAASVTIWWTPPTHPEFWMQGNERARAPGSMKTLIAMFYSGSGERYEYEKLRKKQASNNRVVDWDAEFKKMRKHDTKLENQFMVNW